MLSTEVMKGRHRAFVFVDVAPGKDKKILEKLMEYNEVMAAHIITGRYDLLAVLDFELYARAIGCVKLGY